MWFRHIKHFSTWSLFLVQTDHLEYLGLEGLSLSYRQIGGDRETWKQGEENDICIVVFNDST